MANPLASPNTSPHPSSRSPQINGTGLQVSRAQSNTSTPPSIMTKEQQLAARKKAVEEEMQSAIRASEYHAQLDEARRGSEADEETRLLLIAMNESAELESLQQAQELEKEEAFYRRALEESKLDKGKRRETDEQRQEREEFELALMLSLTEGEEKERRRREGGVRTSREEFERLSIRTDDLFKAPDHQEVVEILSPPITARPILFVMNPDEEVSPPAYDLLPIETSTSAPPTDILHEDNHCSLPLPSTPSPPAPLRRQASASPERIRKSNSTPNRRLSTLSAMSVVARAGSFMSTRSSITSPPSSPPLTPVTNSPPPTTESFYPPFLSAAMGLATSPGRSKSEVQSPSIPRDECGAIREEDGGRGDEEDPFDERFAAVEYESAYNSYGELEEDEYYDERNGTINLRGVGEGEEDEDTARSPVVLSSPASLKRDPRLDSKITAIGADYLPEVSSEPSLLSIASRRESTYSEASSTCGSGSDLEHCMILPEAGGLGESMRANATATSEITADVRFGFQPISLAIRSLHPPLKLKGAFPDVVVLSKRLDSATGKPPFQSFATEAKSWKSLLQYLMWHGNSRIETAAKDLAANSANHTGFSCSIIVEFFRSFEDGSTRVRCRLDLLDSLLPPITNKSKDDLPGVLDREIPNISIRLPPSPLPFTLSTLANMLFVSHTQSRFPTRRRSLASPSPLSRALKNLPLAIDLFKSINGEAVQSAREVEDDEGRLLKRLKGKLRRRKRAPGIVKGGADGTGHNSVIGLNGDLPEGAELVTPFRLDVEE